MKYKIYDPDFLYDKSFYLFNSSLNKILVYYFAKFEIIKKNVEKFLFNLFIILLTKRLSHKNTQK